MGSEMCIRDRYNDMIGLGWRDSKFGDRLVVDEQGKEKRVPRGEGPSASHGVKHSFKVTIRDADHPITKGMPREWLHAADELYHGLRGPANNVHLLATAYSDKAKRGTGEHEPMIWTLSYGKGRVFYSTFGHTPESWDDPAMQTMWLEAIKWAMGMTKADATPRATK